MALSRLARALALALVASACVPPVPSPSPSPSVTTSGSTSPSASPGVVGDMTAALLAKPLPVADQFALVPRLKGRQGTPSRAFEPVRTQPADEAVGTTASFWVYDFAADRNTRTSATLRLLTPHAKWWVADDVTVDLNALARSAQVFEDKIYPTDRRLYGSEWSPGIDGDVRISVLTARIPGAAGAYFSSADELPRWVNEFSAEREMIYVNSLASRPGQDQFHDFLAHEFCHMIQFGRRVRSSTWFDEGHAQICERANGYDPQSASLFLRAPDTQLDTWVDIDEGARQHYGAAYLFLEYLRARTGGDHRFLGTLLDRGVNTVADIDAALRAAGQPPFETIFADWVAANAFVGKDAGAAFRYSADVRLTEPARPASADRVAAGTSLQASVHPQAARYIGLPATGRYTVTFAGPPAVRVIPTDAHSGTSFWWSDRADQLDTTLTRAVDLGSVSSATLSFWSWYDIEPDFDYAYVAVSTDGGTRWTTLGTAATTTTDPNGNNLGNGFTGRSGGGTTASWVRQTADLTPYAGRRILLRFEHVTDAALNKPGIAIDDVEIPEIGYRDDAEADNGWDAGGFVRSTNVVRARYVVQVLHVGATPSVQRAIAEDGAATLEVDATKDGAAPILAVTPLVARSTDPIGFQVTVSAAQ